MTNGSPRGPLTRAYWLMMILCAVCVAAGLVVAAFGPRLFPAAKTAAAQPLGAAGATLGGRGKAR